MKTLQIKLSFALTVASLGGCGGSNGISNPDTGTHVSDGSVQVTDASNSGGFVVAASPARPTGTGAYGGAVALSADGNTLVVGDATGGAGNLGAAYVYTRSGATWSAAVSLTRPASATSFGYAVALSSDANTIAVGDPGQDVGTVTVYRKNNGTWSAGTAVTPPASAFSIGVTLALSGDGSVLAAGDTLGGADELGSVSVFTRSNDSWSAAVEMTLPADAGAFGASIALSGDGNTLAVGDDLGTEDAYGAVTVYTRAGGNWTMAAITRPADATTFGLSVALSADGNTLVVGDVDAGPSTDAGTDSNGAVSVYSRSNGAWSAPVALQRPSAATEFGTSVSASANGNVIAVGDRGTDSMNNSSVTVYLRNNATWTSTTVVRPANAMVFGISVALSGEGNLLAVGDESGTDGNGAVSLYTR